MGHSYTSLEHILAELERVDRLIQLQVWRLQKLRSLDDRFQGLYVTDEDVDRLLGQPIGYPAWRTRAELFNPETDEPAAKQRETVLAFRAMASQTQEVPLRLLSLANKFGLDAIDLDLLLIALAPEIDLRYEKLYGYLQDDVTRKRPSIDLALSLLSGGGPEKLKLRSHLGPESPLVSFHLIQFSRDPHQPQAAQCSDGLQLNPTVLRYLLELPGLDAAMQGCCTYSEPQQTVAELLLPPACLTTLQQGIAMLRDRGAGCLYLQGATGLGQVQAAAAIAHSLKLGLLAVALPLAVPVINQSDFGTWWCQLVLAAWQHQALLYLEGLEAILSGERQIGQQLQQVLVRYDAPVVVAGSGAWPFMSAGVVPWVVPFALPDFALRQRLWGNALQARQLKVENELLVALSDRFRLSAAQIQAAATQASQALQWTAPATPSAEQALFAAARTQSGEHHLTLAKKITLRFTWEDIILLPDQAQLLKALCSQVVYRPKVYGEWGFNRKLVLGKGISTLFAGPPGTGKTMAAEAIAQSLQLELYKIDLSQVVNKYIGETEKNLSRIFDAAEQSNAILLFDEADALFGKRSEVKDAHDRYANLEVAYLLQKIEEYEGIAILTTNLRQNLDEAFIRRIRFVVEFPFPEEAQRLQIWQTIWPAELELAEDVDFQAVAREFKLAGGNIRNIALAAAFLAAAETKPVGMAHVLQAIRQELSKMGRLVSPEVFSRLLGDSTA